ncbi:PKD domain-containing protein [Planktotalea arctica]|uniref:PKD domain-containing protein n=1 Tax=Planktotalea arctica TaxID=1481893 RepID=UPI003219D9DF
MIKQIAMVVATVIAASPPAWGFSTGSSSTLEKLSKNCNVETMLDVGSTKRAWVMISLRNQITLPGAALNNVSGGTYWDGDAGSATALGGIDETLLASCRVSFVAGSLVQRGADSASFAAQDLMGFGYYVENGAGRVWVEYTIGSGTLQPAEAPVAEAGLPQTVASGATVTLDGTGSSDLNGDDLTYTWTQTSGAAVSLSSATTSRPTFTAPALAKGDADVSLEFQLIVNDGTANSTADTVTITVDAPDATTADAPTGLTATAGDRQVSVAFAAPADNGGLALTDYEYQLDGGTWVSASTTSSPVVITELTNGTSYSIKLRAVSSLGKGAASEAVTVLLGSPQIAFDEREDDIRQVMTQDAMRSLQGILNANQRMTRDARERFATMVQASDDSVSRNSVSFDVDGTFILSETRLSTQGTFFEQRSNVDGTARRLFFGDFDLQHDGDSGSTTATITARMAWEQTYGDKTMLGYFIGGELAHSNIMGRFEGKQDRLGLSFGGYAVHQLDERVFLNGFITLGAGRNNLVIADDVLALESDYTTRTATVGAALSGAYDFGKYEFHPELAFSYGKTWIGDVGFTGRAYGLVDDTLSLNAGNVSLANLTLRPELIWALDADTVAESNSQLSFAPRLICERVQSTTTTQNCGAGGEIGLASTSRDGMSSAKFRVIVDKVGNSTRSSLVLNFERKF